MLHKSPMSTESQQPTESTWRNLLIALAWVLLAFGLLVQAFRMKPKPHAIGDFVQEWTSARNHFRGEAVYADLRPALKREGDFRGVDSLPITYNAHPPVAVLMTLPLGHLGYSRAHFTWNCISLTAGAFALWLVLGRFGLRMPSEAWAFVGAILMFSTPFARHFVEGQLNLVLLVLIVAGWCAMRHRKDSAAGLFLGTAAAMKLFPAFLFLFPLMRRRWRVISVGGATFFAWHIAAWVVLGGDALRDYATVVIPALGEFQDWWSNASILGYFRRLTHVTSGHNVPFVNSAILCYSLVGLSIVAVSGSTAYLIHRRGAMGDGAELRSLTLTARREELLQRVDLPFSACIVANLLVSPITWDHYFLLLILPILVLWAASRRWWQRGLLLAIAVILSLNVSWIWDPLIAGDHELAYLWGGEPSVATPWETVTLLSYQFYTLLALLVLSLCIKPAEASESATV